MTAEPTAAALPSPATSMPNASYLDSAALPGLPPLPAESIDLTSEVAALLGGAPLAGSDIRPGPPGYELLRRLGQGAMGEVFLARHVRLKRFVAVKMIRSNAATAELRKRFLTEAEAIARLQHPNIVQIYEVGETPSGPFLALEYADGGSLEKYLTAPLPPAQAAALIETLARAAHHAHERGLIHRDLKPANVLLQKGESSGMKDEFNEPSATRIDSSFILHPSSFQPKITDFGLAHDLAALPSRGIAGTPSYMAPEQAAGRSDGIGPRTDVYALGAILYECLTGRPPFAEPTAAETLTAVRERDVVPMRQIRPGMPRDLETICHTCLRKEPDRRYATAAALADDLGRFVRGEPVAARPVSAVERAWKWARRRPVVATLSGLSAAAVLTVLIGGAIYQERLRHAVRQADRERDRAEANYREALAAVDRLLTRVGQNRLANVPEAEGVRADLLRDALEFYRRFLTATDDPDPALRWETARAFARVAQIQQYLGQSKDSEAHYREAIDRLEVLAAEFPDKADFRDSLADAHRQLGDLRARGATPERAGEQFDRARALWLELTAADAGNIHYRAQVATCDHLTGWWHQRAGRLAEAETAFLRALTRRRDLADNGPTDDARRDLALTLHNLAGLCLTTHRADHAFRHQTEAVQLFEALARSRPGDEENRPLWSGGLHSLGVMHSWAGRLDDARRCHEQALALREALARAHPLVPDFQDGVAQSCMSLAAVELVRGRATDAEPHARRAVVVLERLDQERPQDLGGAATLLGAQTNLALLYQSTKRPDEAVPVYARALAVAERLTAAQPDNLHHATALAALCNNRGILDKDRGRPAEALAWFERAIQAAEAALAKDARLMEAQTWRMYAHGSRAQACEQLRDYAAAIRDWDRVVDWSPAAELRINRLLRLMALARGGEYARADAEATALADGATTTDELLHLAGSWGATAARARGDDRLSPADRQLRVAAAVQRGMDLLRRALAVADLRKKGAILLECWKDPDLRALRVEPRVPSDN